MLLLLGFATVAMAASALAVMQCCDAAQSRAAATALRPRDHDCCIFVPAMVAGLPEVARRYFAFSIEPGTNLRPRVELEMTGTFILGSKGKQQAFSMKAWELLAPPTAFVWRPLLRRGPMWIAGSDGLVEGKAWTRFWLLPLIPVARSRPSPDLNRSAVSRSLLEAIWAPASLLPQNGASWKAIDSEHAEVSFAVHGESFSMTLHLGPDGRPLEVSTQRWSNANEAGVFRLQPFGARATTFKTFGGFTIPARVEVGNAFGTEGYFPFFIGEIEAARYF